MLADWAAMERSLGRGESSCEWVGWLECQCIVLNKEHHSVVIGIPCGQSELGRFFNNNIYVYIKHLRCLFAVEKILVSSCFINSGQETHVMYCALFSCNIILVRVDTTT